MMVAEQPLSVRGNSDASRKGYDLVEGASPITRARSTRSLPNTKRGSLYPPRRQSAHTSRRAASNARLPYIFKTGLMQDSERFWCELNFEPTRSGFFG